MSSQYLDFFGRTVAIGDYVFFSCRISRVVDYIPVGYYNEGGVDIKGIDDGYSESIPCSFLLLLDKEDVMAWALKNGVICDS